MSGESERFGTWAKNSIKEPPIQLNHFKFEDLSKKTEASQITNQDKSPN